ncbi:MAG: peptidase M10, partial [Flavisolibacter sp.]
MWNEPHGTILIHDSTFQIVFRITAEIKKEISKREISKNKNPRANYFRIEEYVNGNISFVDGLGCNTGHFKLENLYEGSTTAAHEYGHTLGLDHPKQLDIRGKGVPGIMYPRGTLVDPQFQYDPTKPAGVTGGTMHPMYRKVFQTDIDQLKLHELSFRNKRAILGNFTNVYHWSHQP